MELFFSITYCSEVRYCFFGSIYVLLTFCTFTLSSTMMTCFCAQLNCYVTAAKFYVTAVNLFQGSHGSVKVVEFVSLF